MYPFINVSLPLVAGLNRSWGQVLFSTCLGYLNHFTSRRGLSPIMSSLDASAGVGVVWRITDRFFLQPEVHVTAPLVGHNVEPMSSDAGYLRASLSFNFL